MSNKIKLPRVAKGKKPKYLDDGSIDNLMAMIMTLTQEISVLRDRVDTLERTLENKNMISGKELDEFIPSDDLEATRKNRRHELLERVLLPIKKDLE
ncbi:MAG: hypothetical protein QF513_00360 [Gammaproteobacteria bacterium]|jgi:hypothetical protein|nr:hypothetical protein [Gammaproteobacteria bacterium]MBQ09239.1 hypothetical protein [Gammaproteobacteria bacterium]MDP6146233.1 hypothetical protein [Gammaproteobacteria bacterium]HJL80319.1 hypothetical protein [Gammaproteobacteria bacterium]HJM09640.1 hypothetical protein [Gammaproteobacteria bacterium]|tara:strand:+ start:39898 stop:40188 length:291 start_codon:yes stop_codon:yes gene_type:complete